MKNFITGIFIGIGSILPGISSGVFCVIFGIYEKLINSTLHFFNDVKKNIKFLLPIVFGILISIFICSNILKTLFDNFYIPISFAFIGLVLGSIPMVIKQADIPKISFGHIVCILVFLSFSIYLTALESTIRYSLDISSNFYLFLAGFLMSAGIVIPGVSKTVILMILGIYDVYLTAISTLNLQLLIPISIGISVGGIIFLILLQFLFKHIKSYTHSAIIGFVIGSVFVLYPGFTFNLEGLIAIILFFLCFFAGLKLS